jgi:peptide/nickel transport system substrate-binding protein
MPRPPARLALPAVLALALAPGALAPAAQAQHLTAAMAAPITSIDPHFYNAAPNNGLGLHIYERLVERTPAAQLAPGLAESWTPIGETAWEFKLRPGAKWHDGAPVTADDVVFTIGRVPNVPNSPGGFAGMVRMIAKVEAVDASTVRMTTRRPAPNLPIDMVSVHMISRKHGEGAATEDYNAGRAAIGSGPFKLARFAHGDRTELVRNEAWDKAKPAWERVTFRFIPNPGARVAALLAGDVDLIDVPPASDLPRLKADPKLSVVSIQGLRTIYLGVQRGRDTPEPFVTDNAGNKFDKSPFEDIRVRRALSIAINRQAIAERVMQGTADATGQWLPPGTYSHAPNVKVPAYAPDEAKKLLAEAGFPQGFKLTLHTPNDRYPNDSQTAQAVAQMWTRIGVQTTIEAMPWSTFSVRGARLEYSAALGGWGSNTAEAGYLLINIIGTYDRAAGRGASNARRYSNPALDALTDRAMSTFDPAAREKLLIQAVEMATDDVALIPLHQLVNFWATKKSVAYTPRMDERTVAMDAQPVK